MSVVVFGGSKFVFPEIVDKIEENQFIEMFFFLLNKCFF